MTRRTAIGTALLGLSVVLFVLPALAPVQPVLVHDTDPGTFGGPGELREEGVRIVSYDELSERGQELYLAALDTNGEYQVPQGEGAPAFEYPTSTERSDARGDGQERPGVIAVERPVDGDLPPGDEPFSEASSDDEDDERRQTAQRYDLMRTATEPPGLGAQPQLLRLAAVLLATLSLGVGGYLRGLNAQRHVEND